MRRLALAVLLILAATCGEQEGKRPAEGALAISADPVGIGAGTLSGLVLRGTVELHAGHPEFGGFSGLAVRQGRMIAVTDKGWLLEADLADGAGGLRPERAEFRTLRDTEGYVFTKTGGDAEGVTLRGDELWISFERDHRLVRYEGTRPVATIRDRAFEALASNSGLEALATLPDGRLLAIAEDDDGDGFPVFVATPDGAVAPARLPRTGRHDVTGADVGPDGRLYVVLRHYSLLSGVSIRIHRYDLTEAGMPDPATRAELAAFESDTGIDNMEGIALWTDAQGRLRLTLISDDNFRYVQRTLVMDFEVVTPGR